MLIKISKKKKLPFGGIVPAPKPNTEQEGMITGNWRVLRSIIDHEKCTLCRNCWINCPDGCIKIGEEQYSINLKYCKGCRICASVCPSDAISRVPEINFKGGVIRLENLF